MIQLTKILNENNSQVNKKLSNNLKKTKEVDPEDLPDEPVNEVTIYHPSKKELMNVSQGSTVVVDWNGQGKVSYKVLSKNNKELKLKGMDGRKHKLSYDDYDSVNRIQEIRLDEKISRSFSKAAEHYQKEQLKLQDIMDKQEDVVGRFKKAKGDEKEKLKKEIIKLHRQQKEQMKKVHQAESKFEKALNNEPVELEEASMDFYAIKDGEIYRRFDSRKDASTWLRDNRDKHSGVSLMSKLDWDRYKERQKNESTRLTDMMKDIKKESTGCGCGCGCGGSKKVSENSVELQRGREWDIGAAQHATGTFFYNRKEEEHGDYKNLAKVDHKGNVTYLDKKLPSFVKNHIEKFAKRKEKNESMNEATKPSKTIEKFQDIVDSSSRARISGTMVDLTTAGIVTQVYNQANDRMKEKLNKLNAKQLINLAFKVIS